MQISQTPYEVFYQKICEVFAKNYRNGQKPPGTKDIYSRKLWDEVFKSGKDKGEFISPILFAGNSKKRHRDYFYRPDLDKVDEIWMYNGLVLLEYKLPESFPKDASEEDKAKNLWDQFIQEYSDIIDNLSIKNNVKSQIDERSKSTEINPHKVKGNEFHNALNTISNYYLWAHDDQIPYEKRVAELLEDFVQQRVYDEDSIDGFHFWKEDRKRPFVNKTWEIYELHGEKVICRSLEFKDLPNAELEPFTGYKSFIVLGRENDIDRSDTTAGFIYDRFDHDLLHETIMVHNCNYERMREHSNGQLIEMYQFTYQFNLDRIYSGHKCELREASTLTCVPAFLAPRRDLRVKKEPYYFELDVHSRDIPNAVKSRLLGWKSLNLNPFKNAFLTTHMMLGGTYHP